MTERKVVPFDEFYYQLKLMYLFQKHPVLLFSEFVCKLGFFGTKKLNLHTNELYTSFCSTTPLKALNRLKSLKLA
jgi:hypothetical protein